MKLSVEVLSVQVAVHLTQGGEMPAFLNILKLTV